MSLEVESLSSSLQWLLGPPVWLVATELRRSSSSRLKCEAAYSTRSDGRLTRTLTVKSISRLLSSAGISYCGWLMMARVSGSAAVCCAELGALGR